jgi:hypothetical protein
MVHIVLINFSVKTEVAKFLSLNSGNANRLKEYLSEGYTEIGYDEQTGDVLFAVHNGKIIHTGNKNVEFKRAA